MLFKKHKKNIELYINNYFINAKLKKLKYIIFINNYLIVSFM